MECKIHGAEKLVGCAFTFFFFFLDMARHGCCLLSFWATKRESFRFFFCFFFGVVLILFCFMTHSSLKRNMFTIGEEFWPCYISP